MNRTQVRTSGQGWAVWLKTRVQRIAAFCVLLMAVLGIFGEGHAHAETERPILTRTRVIQIDSGASGGGASGAVLPRLSVSGSGLVLPLE